MRRLLWILPTGLAGCEGCDFSFGPIPLEVRVTPADAEASVIVCDDEGDDVICVTLGPTSETATSWNPAPSPPGAFAGSVGWDGYVTCRYPALEIDVTAPGCAPFHLSLPRSKPIEGGIVVEAALDCS